MSDVTKPTNIIEGITNEIIRVMAIKTECLAIPGGAGTFAALMMQAAIDNARAAQASGDIMLMIPAYKALKEFEL